MKIYQSEMKFLLPAFLGNSEQLGQWRTPPIKALLRQWWRVAYAADKKFVVDVNEMRQREGILFGNAWLENRFCKSQVRIRLNRWDEGKLKKKDWTSLEKVVHTEVSFPIASDLYMGFGPIVLPRGENKPTLKANAAIQAGESATLSIAVPEVEAPLVEHALWLMDRYGTLGGRSRNGWGSFSIEPRNESTCKFTDGHSVPVRPWRDCLKLDWPHAIGSDDKGELGWQTGEFEDWQHLMKLMAEIKIKLRTQFKFTAGRDTDYPEERHWLSYPVTNHSVKSWDKDARRLSNNLRFKLRRTPDGKLVGVVFHVPHLPPSRLFKSDPKVIEGVWSKVHSFLDENNNLNRSKGVILR